MSIAKDLINKSLGILNVRIGIEKKFFDVPPALKAIRAASGVAVQGILSGLKSQILSMLSSLSAAEIAQLGLGALLIEFTDDNVKAYVKRDKDIRRINQHLANTVNATDASEIDRICNDEDNLKDLETIISNVPLDENDFMKMILSQSDFDDKIGSSFKGLEDLYNKAMTILPWLLLVYEMFLRIKDFITSNRYPSKFRAGYLKGQLREMAGMIKNSAVGVGTNTANQIISLVDGFKTIDAVIAGLMMGTILYLKNRGDGQEKSNDELQTVSLANNCAGFDLAGDVSIAANPIIDPLKNFACPLPDTAIVPHEPIEDKLNRLDCGVELEEDKDVDGDIDNSLATKAIIENLSTDPFSISVKMDQRIENDTVIGQIGESVIYSSVTGYVNKLETNSVWIRDISDIGKTLFEETTDQIKLLYEELNDSKLFIKDFYLQSWYPPMLSSTPFVDPSVNTSPSVIFTGIGKAWESIKKSGERVVENYNNEIQKITGKDNVKKRADNNELGVLKAEFDDEEELLFKNLNLYADRGINRATITKVVEGDLTYGDYLFDLLERLAIFDDQNNIVTTYTKEINSFLTDRYFVEKYNLDDIKSKINSYCRTLDTGNYRFESVDYYGVMTSKYNQGSQVQSEIKSYVESLGNGNSELSGAEKEDIVSKTVLLFNFTRDVLELENLEEGYVPEENINQLAFKEGNFIKNYFGQLNKRINEIPEEIIVLEKLLDDLGASFVPPSIKVIDDEQYEWYGVKGPERTCPVPEEENPYLSPYSAYNQGDIEYWLKYCAFATLASVANPLRGWATGFPPPIGPIPFPVVYIPFKSFMTKWGFIVVGLTITGIYPFPWVLFSNMSSNYNTPIGDPTALVKNQITAAKKVLSDNLKTFKQNTLKGYLNRTGEKVQLANANVERITTQKTDHRTNKPVRDRTKTKRADRQAHITQLANWEKTQVIYTEELATAKTERFVLESKYKVVEDAYTGVGSIENVGSDQSLKAIEKQATALDLAFEKLDVLIEKVNKILIPLPISMKPNSANFAITAKNPKPIVKIKTDIDQTVNNGAVGKIIEKFSLKSDDFMSSNFAAKSAGSILNYSKYKQVLSASMFTLLDEDPFPKYENLQPTNIAWLPFLYNNFTVVGGQTFGFPGQPPIPIG